MFMTKAQKQKIIGVNAAIWTGASLLSFVLPLIAESITDGRGNFLKMMAHMFPLLFALLISSNLLNSAIGETTE